MATSKPKEAAHPKEGTTKPPPLSARGRPALSKPTASLGARAAPAHGKSHHPPSSAAGISNPPLAMRRHADKSPSPQPRVASTSLTSLKERSPKAPSSLPKTAASPKLISEKSSSAPMSGRTRTSLRARSPVTNAKRRESKSPVTRTSSASKAMVHSEEEEEPHIEIAETESIASTCVEENLHDDIPDLVEIKDSEPTMEPSPDQADEHDPISPEKSEETPVVDGEVHCVVKKEEEEKECPKGMEENPSEETPMEPKEEGGDGEKPEDNVEMPADAEPTEAEDQRGEEPPPAAAAAVETTDKVPAAATERRPEAAMGWRKEAPKSNDVIEETRSKLLEKKRSKVRALVGAFETVMSEGGRGGEE